MPEKISILIVDDITSTLDNLQKLLSFEEDIEVIGTAGNGVEAVEVTKRLNPAVVLMDVNMPEMDGIQATEVLASEAPASPVIIMSVQGERDYLRRAMQAGAREFLIKPFSGDELIASIRRVNQLEQRKETYRTDGARLAPAATAEAVATVEASAGSPEADEAEEAGAVALAEVEEAAVAEAVEVAEAEAPPEPEPAYEPPANGELIVLYSGKGGVGKSVLAINLACSLARETGARVGLVDLALQFGDLGVLLNLPQTQSITDLIENINVLDSDFVRDIMAEGPSGIRVLPTPPSPELADLVTPEHVQAIFAVLRTMYDFIIVDTASHLGDITLTALDQASRLVIVTSMSIPAVKNAKLALKLCETLNISSEKIVVVLNRCEAHTEFNKESIEAHLKFPIAIQIPHDPRTVINSINRGTPFVVANPEAEASQRLRQLVAALLPERSMAAATADGKRSRRFGRR